MKSSEDTAVLPAEGLYDFAGFRLDAANHLLFRHDGSPVPLTPKVFDTLLVLVHHAGTVLAKERLMDAVWPDSVVEENNLSQNISALRRILGETRGANRFIVTVPGRGYRFVAPVRTSAAHETVLPPPQNKTEAPSLKPLPLHPSPPSRRQLRGTSCYQLQPLPSYSSQSSASSSGAAPHLLASAFPLPAKTGSLFSPSRT